jgi:hypothetical protein
MKTILPLVSVLTTLAVSSAMAQTTYPADGANYYGGVDANMTSVVINNNATSISFQVNLNTSDSTVSNPYDHYLLGLQMGGGAGGQTLINGTYGTGTADGNPYGNAVGISTGENFFIGTYMTTSGVSTGLTGGAQLYSFSTLTGWTQIGANAPLTIVPTGTPSIAFSFSLSSFGLSAGNKFNFDAWSSFSSPQSAYQALDNPNLPPGTAPYNSGASYDSATAAGSTFATTIYTVQATPEPSTFALLGLGALGMIGCLRRRNVK